MLQDPFRQLLTYFFLAAAFSQVGSAQGQAATANGRPSADQKLLTRHYAEGEKLSYHMKATNQDRHGTLATKFKPTVSSRRIPLANSWKNLPGPIWW